MPDHARALSKIYENRKNFIVIGITGRTGAGCTSAASIFSKNQSENKFPVPDPKQSAEDRKYQLCYNYIQKNWSKFYLIEIKNIITSFIVENAYDDFIKYLINLFPSNHNVESKISPIKAKYDELHHSRMELNKLKHERSDNELILKRRELSYQFYFKELPEFTDTLKKSLSELSEESYIKVYQKIGDNIRKSGLALSDKYDSENIFRIPIRINKIIKLLRKKNNKGQTCVVLDALRNPFEAIYFRERYSAFYLISINALDKDRIKRLQTVNNLNNSQIKEIDDKEYPDKLEGINFFTSQNIQQCIDFSDIHLNNNTIGKEDYSELKKQIVRYVALIMHPGIVTPSHEERCMQIAYNAKLNSGCMSRQVGALVCDKNFNIKSIGWNCVPKGQISCSLRSVKDLINNEDKKAFSNYENNDDNFRAKLKEMYSCKVDSNDVEKKLNGLNLAFCFKTVQNKIDDEKNQVHTRAMHAEENAFIQIAKNGGVGVEGGILFSTASPCELCSKKAYQIGISKIIYIDPYPGIAVSHILDSGTNKPVLKLFSGAIGRAYTQLYESILPYKDEIELLIE